MDYISLGKNMRRLRRKRGLTQEDLAELCDCCNAHIAKIENARGIPSLEMVVRIANALDATVDQLLYGSYSKPELFYLKEITERIEKYPPTKRKIICSDFVGYLDTLDKWNK